MESDIGHLEASAASGNQGARFDLAMALLSGRPPAGEVLRAVELLELASSAGHAEASERLALLECMGVARPSNWHRSLAHLQRAAEQGSASARSQLLLLADNERNPASAPDDCNWREVRAQIDIHQRLKAGEREALAEIPRVRALRQFLTPAECAWLIAIARPRLDRATVFDKSTGEQTYAAARDNSFLILQLTLMDVVTEVIRNRISAATRLPVPLFEPTQILHYAVGERFRPHHDFLDPKNPGYRDELASFGQRIGTFLIYLNEEFEGGETSFPALGLKFQGRTGDALFFANVDRDGEPEPRSLHAGLPPTSGEKWLLSQWIRDRPPAA